MGFHAGPLVEPQGEELGLGGLSRAVEAFEGDEFAWGSGMLHGPKSYKELGLREGGVDPGLVCDLVEGACGWRTGGGLYEG